ncbi:MAG: GDSL-type esterase/lipase family protein [Ruminiclostridium sp.]
MNDKEIKLENYRKENKTAVKGETVLTGSSLMEMFPVNKFLDETGNNRIVYNRAIGGYISDELLAALDTCVLELKPRRVFINIGTNDLSDSRIPMERLMGNYDKILTIIEENVPGVEIYLMAYYPVNYEAAAENMKECLKVRSNEKIILANKEVEKLAAKHKQHYIDINDNLKDDKGRLKAEYTIEGLHINETGYRAIFPQLLKYIEMPFKS